MTAEILHPASIMLVGEVKHVPVGDLKLWTDNPRNNEHAVEPLSRSIAEYGMNVPLLINAKNEVIAGNTRLKACRLLGMTHVPVIDGSHLSADQQQAYNIADNKFAEIAHWNHDMLRDILEQQRQRLQDAFDPTLLGFNEEEMSMQLDGWQSDAKVKDIEEDDGEAPGRITITCPQGLCETLKKSLQAHIEEEGLHGVSIK